MTGVRFLTAVLMTLLSGFLSIVCIGLIPAFLAFIGLIFSLRLALRMGFTGTGLTTGLIGTNRLCELRKIRFGVSSIFFTVDRLSGFRVDLFTIFLTLLLLLTGFRILGLIAYFGFLPLWILMLFFLILRLTLRVAVRCFRLFLLEMIADLRLAFLLLDLLFLLFDLKNSSSSNCAIFICFMMGLIVEKFIAV